MKTILALVCGFGIAQFALIASEGVTPSTIADLQAAFNGESNAHARYLAFAKKADAEGYGGVASLFRAAARAEEIHAGNHAAVIKNFGGVPESKVEMLVVKSTPQNLKEAIKGETNERDQMYPRFIQHLVAPVNTNDRHRGGGHPHPCHTTVRTGPYTTVRVGYANTPRTMTGSQSDLKVGIRKTKSKGLGPGEVPRAAPAPSRITGRSGMHP